MVGPREIGKNKKYVAIKFNKVFMHLNTIVYFIYFPANLNIDSIRPGALLTS